MAGPTETVEPCQAAVVLMQEAAARSLTWALAFRAISTEGALTAVRLCREVRLAAAEA